MPAQDLPLKLNSNTFIFFYLFMIIQSLFMIRDSRNVIESEDVYFFSNILRTILNKSDILFGSDCKREN